MARYLYSELASAVQARRNCAQHNYSCLSVVDGWQTQRADGTLIGPVFNSSTDLWAWQKENLSDRTEWFDRWSDHIKAIENELPSGSGFDNGTKLDLDSSHAEKLVFTTAFHHMHESGMYDGWTDHTITVTPSFGGFNIRISGRNRNDIKEYIGDTFHCALMQEITFKA